MSRCNSCSASSAFRISHASETRGNMCCHYAPSKSAFTLWAMNTVIPRKGRRRGLTVLPKPHHPPQTTPWRDTQQIRNKCQTLSCEKTPDRGTFSRTYVLRGYRWHAVLARYLLRYARTAWLRPWFPPRFPPWFRLHLQQGVLLIPAWVHHCSLHSQPRPPRPPLPACRMCS